MLTMDTIASLFCLFVILLIIIANFLTFKGKFKKILIQ